MLVVDDPADLQDALDRALVTARATALARDLTNTPSLTKTPAWLAGRATALLADLSVRVRDEHELAAEGFGGLVGVGQGSTRPPRLVEARYDGGGRHVVLVGKGITFDSGGLSLKPTDAMLTMKTDMGGAAAVLGALRAVADLRLPITVTALLACAENMPSGTAQRPGDVLTQYGGRTVEVLNTDAEGRLVLADALAYADRELQPDVLVDVATLTGAMPVALGKRHAGLFASDDALAAELAAVGGVGERLWRMPLVEDYRRARLADGRPAQHRRPEAQAQRRGHHRRAVPARVHRWPTVGAPRHRRAVLDGQRRRRAHPAATGYGVRLLVRWLEKLSARPARRRPARRGA